MLVSLGAPEEKVFVFFRGVDTPSNLPPRDSVSDRAPTVLMIGRFVGKKGFEDGIEAFGKVKTNVHGARLKIIGSGSLRPKYEEIIARLGLGGAVSLLGEMPQERVFVEMNRADVLLVPSLTGSNGDVEGVPNVLKEGNARGLPAVVTRHGGMPEMVDNGVNGFVVEERDTDAMAQKLSRLLRDFKLRREMGAAAWRRMKEEFNYRTRNEVLEQHYDDVYDNHLGN
jgi:colanic acid/amylovoran biosynthesis glycosyltransferase